MRNGLGNDDVLADVETFRRDSGNGHAWVSGRGKGPSRGPWKSMPDETEKGNAFMM
jgi:hypothetical protein